jgi:integrase
VSAFVRGRESELVGSVTPDAIAQHIQREDWSARRRHGVLIDLGTFFGWLVRMEWLTRSPVAKVPKPILEPTAPSVLTPDETERLLRAAEASDPELIGYLALALFAGLRPESELGRLTPQDIGPEHVTVTTGAKTRRRRLVRISGNLAAFLGRWSALSGKLVPVNFARRIRKVRKLAGLESWPQDVMRHSFVSYHYALHGEADTVAQAGHSAEMLHEHYRGLVTAAQAAAYFAIMPRSEPYSQRQTDRAPMTTERARRLAGMRWSRP